MTLSRQLLEILVCPKCKGGITFDETRNQIVCDACEIAYPVRDDIPVMLIDEALPLSRDAKPVPE
jgi:uncharacterized protein YbaR (Trm112 family)